MHEKRLRLKSSVRHKFTALLLCISLLLIPKQAKAGFLSGGQVVGIFVGVAAIGAAIGVGIYFAVRRGPSITGCAVSSASGLSLQNEGDQETYTLIGDTAGIKIGDRIKVSGKKKKKDPSGSRDFLVEKLAKDHGPCKVLPATP
jgi:hypothetical protein